MTEVTILLSVYNGSRWLQDQLDSILYQSFTSWKLIIRDDGSQDDSIRIVSQYVSNHPNKITLINDNHGNVGVKNSFNFLLKYADTSYIAFCDQDDYWMPEKLSKLVHLMKAKEINNGDKFPLLVHSDLEITDENLIMINPSFFGFTGLSPQYSKSHVILFKNISPGCSMLINQALLLKAGDVPANAIMHDYWFVLVARYFGKIFFYEESLVKYRQHGKNTLGAVKSSRLGWKDIYNNFFRYKKNSAGYWKKFKPYQKQSECLLFLQGLSSKNRRAIESFIKISNENRGWKRKLDLLVNSLSCGSFKENLEFFLFA